VAAADQVEAWALRYGREIHAYLWRMLRDGQDAEDCLQETFLRALRHRSTEPILQPRAWLYAIAGNVGRSQLRRRRAETDRRTSLEADVPAPDGTPGRDRWEAVRRAVEALPARQREALLLRRYQGLDYEEVARVMGSSAPAARANVYQAIHKLRDAFPEEAR
jgi:RNA polymerase sigma-70 factor (ECF subfamily)